MKAVSITEKGYRFVLARGKLDEWISVRPHEDYKNDPIYKKVLAREVKLSDRIGHLVIGE